MWSGPAARLPKALDKLAKDLEACPPSRALVMLHRSDVASIRHRLLECIQVLEDARPEPVNLYETAVRTIYWVELA